MIRIRAYLDGYNLYHAIDRLNDNQLKWVDLWKLSNQFVPSADAQLVGVVYFSAYAKWRPDKMRRHKAYVSALQATGTSVHLSRFKTKDTYCPSCKTKHRGHEEKETDVLIALRLFNDARNNEFDRALLISRDSDLVPAIKMTKAEFPTSISTLWHPQMLAIAPKYWSTLTENTKLKPHIWRDVCYPNGSTQMTGQFCVRQNTILQPKSLPLPSALTPPGRLLGPGRHGSR